MAGPMGTCTVVRPAAETVDDVMTLDAPTEEAVAAEDVVATNSVGADDVEALLGPAEPVPDPVGDASSAAPETFPEHPAMPATSRPHPAPRSARRETTVGMISELYCPRLAAAAIGTRESVAGYGSSTGAGASTKVRMRTRPGSEDKQGINQLRDQEDQKTRRRRDHRC